MKLISMLIPTGLALVLAAICLVLWLDNAQLADQLTAQAVASERYEARIETLEGNLRSATLQMSNLSTALQEAREQIASATSED